MAVNLKKGAAGMQKENPRMFTLGLKSLKFKMRKRNSRFGVALMTLLSICMGLIFVPHLDAQEMIDPHSGLMVATAADLIVDAGAINLEVQRSLQLRHSFKGMLGAGWQMNWETRLYPMADFVLIEENGLLIRFDPRTDSDHYAGSGEDLIFDVNRRATRHKADGSREIFDPQGRLIERDLGNGNKVFLRYDDAGRLARIDGPKGSFLKFGLNERGHVIRVDASRGRTLKYGYTKGRLTQVEVNNGYAIRYSYSPNGNLIKIDEPQTGAVEFAYDAKGRVISRRWADGSQERYEFDDEKNIRRHIDAGGNVTTSRWSKDNRRVEITDALGNQTTIEYDGAGQMTKISGSAGVTAQMTYDDRGRIAAIKDPTGQTTQLEYVKDSPLVKRITRPDCTAQVFEYDQNRNLTGLKIGATTISEFSYHPDGLLAGVQEAGAQKMNFAYFPDGNLKSIKNALGETTRFVYDARGNLVRQINPLGGETIWQYDDQDRLISQTDPLGRTIRYAYNSLAQLVRLTDPAGGVTRYDYDARGRLVAETDPAGRTNRYEYDRAGRLASNMAPEDRVERFRYDAAGNMKEWIDGLGRITRYHHDPMGRLIAEKQPGGLEVQYRYDSLGNLVSVADSAGGKSEYRLSACGRLTSNTGPLGAITRYEYGALGNLVATIDPLNRIKKFTHTPEGRVLSVSEPTGDESRYEYDPIGRLVKIRRPGGGLMRFEYDAMGSLTAEIDPGGNRRRYRYDPVGRLVRTTDPMGGVTELIYDKMDRVKEERLPDGKRITYEYTAGGDLIRIDDGSFPVNYSYDSEARLTKKEYPAIRKSVAYVYDKQGLQTKLIDSESRETRYEYDSLKQLAAVVLPDGARISFDYDIKGRLRFTHYPNGITGSREYDAAGRITAIRYQDRNKKTVAGWAYRYDAAGNLAEQKDYLGQTTHFRYDPTGQVTEDRRPDQTIRYGYGPGGNRTRSEENGTVTTYRYDVADRLIQRGPEKLTYDKKGRLIARRSTDGITQYEYDASDRLVKVTTPDGETTSYGYTPSGERVWKKDREGLTHYIYDDLDLIQEIGEGGSTKATYIHGPGLDQPLAMIRKGRTYYYHADRLGSIRHLTDDRGAISARYDYDAFGNLRTRNALVPNPFTFTAREFDTSTGLYYYRARYYDSTLGRFLTPDPIAAELDQPLEQNPYLYAMNNPVRFTDPLGLRKYGTARPTSGESLLTNLKGWIKEGIPKGDVLEFLHKVVKPKDPQFAKTWINRIETGEITHYLPNLIEKHPYQVKGWLNNTRLRPLPGYTGTRALTNVTLPGPGSTVGLRNPTMSFTAASGAISEPSIPDPAGLSRSNATRPINTGTGRPPGNTVALPRPGSISGVRVGLGTAGGVILIGNVAACIIEGGGALRCGGELVGAFVIGKGLLWAVPALANPGAVVVLGGIGVAATVYRLAKAADIPAEQAEAVLQELRKRKCLHELADDLSWLRQGVANMTSQADEATNAYNTAQAEAEELEFAEAQISSMMDYLKGLTGRLESASEECKKLESGIKGAIENAIAAKESSEGALTQAFEAAEGCEMGRDEIKELIENAESNHGDAEDNIRSAKKKLRQMREQRAKVENDLTEAVRIDQKIRNALQKGTSADYSEALLTIGNAVKLTNELGNEWNYLSGFIQTKKEEFIRSCPSAAGDANVEFEALRLEGNAAMSVNGKTPTDAVKDLQRFQSNARSLVPKLKKARADSSEISSGLEEKGIPCQQPAGVAQIMELESWNASMTTADLDNHVAQLNSKVEACEENEEEEEEGDPTEDDEWAEGSGRREGSRSITIASGSGGGDGTKTGYSSRTLQGQQEEQLSSFRKPAGGKSGTSSQKSTPSVVTSSTPSSSTTEPASTPSTAEPTPPATSPAKEPGETEESACPPPSLTNTDWTIAYGDVFFFIIKESSSCELIGCIRQRGGAMGICDEKIGTRSGKQVTMEKASYLGGAIWKLQLSSDGQEMNGTQTTKEYGTRKVRVLKD
jgi:RHS repeat-associated protein